MARHAGGHQAERQEEMALAGQADERLSRLGYATAVIIGSAQILALLAGISRSGVTMVAGMGRGLSREDAARFAFLLATPVILAAGVLKIPDLMGPLGNGIRGQILLGSVLSGLGAYVSVRFLMNYFQTRTLYPFAVYCFAFGLLSVIYLGIIKIAPQDSAQPGRRAGTLSAWACRHSSGAGSRRSASRRSHTRPCCWWWTGPTTSGWCWPGRCWPG